MTDNEIIKAAECCFIRRDHKGCPLARFGSNVTECRRELAENTINLINRQKAEIEENQALIERLQNANVRALKGMTEIAKANARFEAIKEFAERLKADKFAHKNFGELVAVEDIDNLAKEMTEETL